MRQMERKRERHHSHMTSAVSGVGAPKEQMIALIRYVSVTVTRGGESGSKNAEILSMSYVNAPEGKGTPTMN